MHAYMYTSVVETSFYKDVDVNVKPYHNDVLILYDLFRWQVYDIGDPYILYRINVTVQQLDYHQIGDGEEIAGQEKATSTKVWRTIGYATIGPEMIGDNTNRKKPGVTSGPEVNNILILGNSYMCPCILYIQSSGNNKQYDTNVGRRIY